MVDVIVAILFFLLGTVMYIGDLRLVAVFKLKKGVIANREQRFAAAVIVGAVGALIAWYLFSHIFGLKIESFGEIGYFLIGWAATTLGLWLGSISVPYYYKWRAGKADPLKDITSTVKEQGMKLATEVATAKTEEKVVEKIVEKAVEAPPVVHETTEVKTEVVIEKKEEPKKEKTFEETLKDFEKP